MIVVKSQPGEPADALLRRFNKAVQNEGLHQEMKKREYYLKPSARRKLEKKQRERKTFRRKPFKKKSQLKFGQSFR